MRISALENQAQRPHMNAIPITGIVVFTFEFTHLLFTFLFLSALCFSTAANAAPPCEDDDFLSGRLFEDVYWGGVRPIKIFNHNIAPGNKEPPEGSQKTLCTCMEDGLPSPGTVVKLWEPIRLMESQRRAGCISSLKAIVLPFDELFAGADSGYSDGQLEKSFYHTVDLTAPLLYMAEIMIPGGFTKGNERTTFDFAYMTPFDPTFSNSALATIVFPETIFMANLIPLCAEEAAQIAIVGFPNRFLTHCLGTWGSMGAPSNHHTGGASRIEEHNFLNARYLAVMHRRGWLKESIGDDSLCDGKYQAFLPKDQYAFSTFNPNPEDGSWHVIGEPTMTFSSQRMIIGMQNTPVSILWRRNETCVH